MIEAALDLLALQGGRPSLQLLVVASLALMWLVSALFVYILVLRGYYGLRGRYREGRRALYQVHVEKALFDAPAAELAEGFRPRRWGDLDVIEEVLLEHMRHLEGPPFEALRGVAVGLGLLERNLRRLRSAGRHRRGRAMHALGVMRAREGVAGLLEALETETLDLRIVALRALAAVGDPAALPHFITASDRLSPPLRLRLASLMLEFGPPARQAIPQLIARHPGSFPVRVAEAIIAESAREAGELR